MKNRTQLIAAAVIAVCAGQVGTTLACESGRTISRRTYVERLAPVGERIVTRRVMTEQPVIIRRTTVTREQPVIISRTTTRIMEEPALEPVAERVIVERPARACYTERRALAPVGERYIIDQPDLEPVGERVVVAESGGAAVARTLTTPIRWVGEAVSAPFRGFRRDRALEPVGERVIVTRTTRISNNCPTTQRLHRRSFKRVAHVRRLPAVAERTTTVRTFRTGTWMY